MNVDILQVNLLRILTRTGRIISAKSQLPIMQHVLLEATPGRLQATATNLETTESVWVGAKTDTDGAVCVPARLLLELVATLPDEAVNLSLIEGGLYVHCGGFEATIPTMGAGEFPAITIPEQKNKINIKNDQLATTLKQVIFAAATDENRPLLTGIRVRSDEEDTILAATDGYRLSVARIKLGLSSKLDLVIPARAFAEVLKITQEEKNTQEISLAQSEDHQLVFSVGDTTILTRALDGEYPNFEKIIPKTHTTRVHFDVPKLLRAVKSAAIFAKDNANIIKLAIDAQHILVSANTPQVGENHIEVEGQVDGDGGEIAFNSRFLLEFLANCTEDEILFEMTGSLNPGVFRPVNDESRLHVIMPVRVQG